MIDFKVYLLGRSSNLNLYSKNNLFLYMKVSCSRKLSVEGNLTALGLSEAGFAM